MVQGPSIAALEALRDASASIDEHIAILKQLKNDIAGHRQRKELVVKQGTVEPLVRVASTSTHAGDGHGWSKQDEARLQATLVLGGLASGGGAFMQPLLAGSVPACLLSALHPRQNPRLLVATLQALRSLVQQSRTNARNDSPLRVNAIDQRSLALFDAVLRRQIYPPQWRQLLHLTTDIIIAAAAHGGEVCTQILDSGVFPALMGLFVKGVHRQDSSSNFSNTRNLLGRDWCQVIATLAALVDGSDYRAQCFIHHPLMHQLLSHGLPADMSALLPELPIAPPRATSFAGLSASFPALGLLQQSSSTRAASAVQASQRSYDTSHAHNVCLLLNTSVKSVPADHCLPVLRLLAAVNNAIDAYKFLAPQTMEQRQKAHERDKLTACTAVQVAIRLVQTACEKNGVENMSALEQEQRRELKPEACEVLASLIRSSQELQVAAVEGGAIKRICPILKKSFERASPTKAMWSSKPPKSNDEGDTPITSRLGPQEPSTDVDYVMRCRRAALEAIAALASSLDVHRQAMINAGVIAWIVDSLKPFAPDAFEKTGKNAAVVAAQDGNTTQVIIAACHAAQSMSRSVAIMRTSLNDASIAKPIFDLLKHPLLEVRVAATDVCCNIVLEFSPMREELLNAGIVRVLAEHARQSEMALRLSSVWALKHLVYYANREIRLQALEELGVGWLVAAIQGQQRTEQHDQNGGGLVINAGGGLSAPNAAGERVDLLNPSSMDVDDPPARSGNHDEEDGEVLYDEASLTHYRASHLRSTLRSSASNGQTSLDRQRHLDNVRDLEQNPTLRARRDDVAVQEQGLDFIRNMLNGEDCAYMLEHLLSQIGTTQLFAMLTEKLLPLNPQSSSSSRTTTATATSARPIYHPTELILSTIHILTHIANGSPPQKQLLIAQKPLLAAWLPHFHHPDRRVRCISVWGMNNLTWIEDEHDRPGARQRCRELRSVGITAAVEGLKGDVDMDVRERVRVAVRQMEGL